MARRTSISIILAVMILCLFEASCIKSVSPAELKASMQIVDVDTMWVSKYYQPWPPRLILVPALSFRVKNVSSKPLSYINFNAVFRFKADNENLGDCFLAAIRRKAVLPGETSDLITLRSNFGVDGRNLNSFKDNPRWRIVVARLFASSRGSQPIALGDFQISQRIDFKEPEAVHMGEKPGAAKEKEKK
jgi:hypothetical protein